MFPASHDWPKNVRSFLKPEVQPGHCALAGLCGLSLLRAGGNKISERASHSSSAGAKTNYSGTKDAAGGDKMAQWRRNDDVEPVEGHAENARQGGARAPRAKQRPS
ncbi:hypothetical protein MRX96_005136 [Rhipicephalus microplus]